MSIFRIQYLIFFVSIIILSISFLCFIILKQQFKYGFVQYESPQSYFNYLSYNANLSINNLNNKVFFKKNTEKKLPIVNIFVEEKNLNFFKNNVPQSNKEWKKAILVDKFNNKIKVSISPRGDNPDNWSFFKKSWKIKFRKSNISGRIREFSYEIPGASSDYFGLKFFSSYYLSKAYGLPTPQFRFIELYINGISHGYYYEIENIDESFLRNNNLMPVNIYKGENYYVETNLGLDNKLFHNSGLWKKISYFNQSEHSNYTDLENHLNQLSFFEGNNISSDEFFNYFPPEIWAKFILSGSGVHGTNYHNQRVFIDPWSGWAIPIIKDPNYGKSLSINDIIYSPNNSLDRLERLFNLDPNFIYKKYLIYDEYVFKKKIYLDLIYEINFIKESLINSIVNDFDFNYFRNNYFNNSQFNKLSKEDISKSIDEYTEYLKLLTNFPFEKNKLKGSWYFHNNNLEIVNSDKIPFGKIKIIFDSSVDVKKIKIFLDTNNQLIPYEIIDSKTIILDTIIIADRIPYSYVTKIINDLIMTRPTRFTFKFQNKVNIKSVDIENIFNKKFQSIKKYKTKAFDPAIYNYIIINNNKNNTQTLSGKIVYAKDKIFNNKVKIKAGTEILLEDNVSLIFKKNVFFDGNENSPITIKQNNINKPWGTVAIVGPDSKGSIIRHTTFNGGSGDKVNNYKFTGMLSIHNTEDVTIDKVNLNKNYIYDDMFHVVYAKNIKIYNSKFSNTYADAIDIDSSSEVKILNIDVKNAKNDCIDFMQTDALITNSYFNNCNDKGVSVGERSNIVIKNTKIINNHIGIESKDDSLVNIQDSILENNETALNAYKKNWRYGNGGNINYSKLQFINNLTNIAVDKNSNVTNQ